MQPCMIMQQRVVPSCALRHDAFDDGAPACRPPAGITAGAEAILALITRVELSRFYTRRAASQVTVLSPKARVAPMASCE